MMTVSTKFYSATVGLYLRSYKQTFASSLINYQFKFIPISTRLLPVQFKFSNWAVFIIPGSNYPWYDSGGVPF